MQWEQLVAWSRLCRRGPRDSPSRYSVPRAMLGACEIGDYWAPHADSRRWPPGVCRRGLAVCHVHPDCRASLALALACALDGTTAQVAH